MLAQTPVPVSTADVPYIRRALLWSRLQFALRVLGDRLEVPGKERLTMTGTLTRTAGSNVAVVTSEPGKVRIDETVSGLVRSVGFDGTRMWTTSGAVTVQDQQLIEMLVNDIAERFFATQMEGQATRFLGERFRLDDGRSATYSGPYYDVYLVAEQGGGLAEARRQKFYYFNSDTAVLERVRYEIGSGTGRTRVEVVLNWRVQDGQRVPARIVRNENGRAVLTLDFPSTLIAPRTADTIFAPPASVTMAPREEMQ